jgi:hypothetical protein
MSDAIEIMNTEKTQFQTPNRAEVMLVVAGGPWNGCSTFSGTLWHLLMAGFAFLICLTFPAVSSAQVVQLHTSTGKGSAVCIGDADGGQLFVTVKHNFEVGETGRYIPAGTIFSKSRSAEIQDVELSYDEDLACFVADIDVRPLPLFRGSLQRGAVVDVPGFGPHYEGRSNSSLVRRARLDELNWVVNTDQQVVPGDSGCPVVYEDQTVALVRAFQSNARLNTQIIPAVKVDRFLKKCQWQCGPGGCYIRQRIRQPIAGIAIPIGPPQIETQIIPAPPQNRPAPRPIPDENSERPEVAQGPRGERGPAGPAGKDGRDGADGSGPDPEYVQQIVISWLEQNRDQLKGDAEDTKEIEKRLKALETRPLKVIIAEGGKLKDEESYLPGEPVVFDLARLRAK